MEEPSIEEALILEWTTAVEALDTDSIQELFDIQPTLLWTPLLPLSHLETDFAHFIRRLKEHKLLGTDIRPVYALHHILYDYGVPDDEWAPERIELVEFILKNTKGNELNTCLWGSEQNTVMHLAYFIQQPELIQRLKEVGALETIPNKSNHLPTLQPEVKLLVNSKPPQKDRNLPTTNASDRFKRLRELAESPNLNKPTAPTTERQNSTRRYFRPGHLEERKRRVLSEEEQAELDKKNLLRQKEVDQLAQRSAVKNNPLFKKFEEERLLKEQEPTAKRTPSITAASRVRDRKKLLGAADQIRRTSRVINSLKDRSYVTTSVFRQTQESDTQPVQHIGNNLTVPTLAQLRTGSPSLSPVASPNASPSVSPNVSPHTSDNEEEDAAENNEQVVIVKKNTDEPKKEESKEPKEDSTKKEPIITKEITIVVPDKKTDKSEENSASNNEKRGVTEDELESLSVGRLGGERGIMKQPKKTKKEIDISLNKVKDIVNVHERLFDENEVEIVPIGKKFAVWKNGSTDSVEVENTDAVEIKRVSEDTTTSSKKSLDLKEKATHKGNDIVESPVSAAVSAAAAVAITKATDKVTSVDKENAATKADTTSIKEKPVNEPTNNTLEAQIPPRPKPTKSSTTIKEPTKEIVKGRVLLVDEQAALNDQYNTPIQVKEKIEYSYQKTIPSKNEPITATLLTSNSVISKQSADMSRINVDDNKPATTTIDLNQEKSRAITVNDMGTKLNNTPTSAPNTTLVSEFNTSSTLDSKLTEKEKPGTISMDKISMFTTTTSSNNDPKPNIQLIDKEKPGTISIDNISQLSSTEINDPKPINTDIKDKQASLNNTTLNHNSSSTNEIKPKSTALENKLTENNKSTNITTPPNNSITTAKEMDATSDEKTKIHDKSVASNDTHISSVVSNTPSEKLTDKYTMENEPITRSIDTNSSQPEKTIPIILTTQRTNTSYNEEEEAIDPMFQDGTIRSISSEEDVTSSFLDDLQFEDDLVIKKKSVLIENETSPIPTLINQIESNEKLNPTRIEQDEHTPSQHTVNYTATPLSNQPSHVRHLQINTIQSQMMIEEESDEDEASTPTLANPYQSIKKPITQQQQSHENSSSDEDDDESRQEWRSAYNSLIADQQQLEFEDDIYEQQQKRTATHKHESISSDLDETTILQTLSFQSNNNHWTNTNSSSKRQSGSQRNHWSIGIQDVTKRESMMSSVAASSEAGSEQWFDPEDDWNEQEELRRQSMLVSGFHAATTTTTTTTTTTKDHDDDDDQDDYYYHRQSDSSINTNSETYSYKNSNSTENTALDEDEDDVLDDKKVFGQQQKQDQKETFQHNTYKQKDVYGQKVLIEEDEEIDYYSTHLHTSNPTQKTRGESSYYHGTGHTDTEHEEEGEIVVFMNQTPVKSRDVQSTEDITTSAFYNNNNASTIAKPNFSASTLSVHQQQREDDEISLIKVPSRTVAIAEAGTKQEYVPHDPNKPRVEDISHYMNKLPAFEKPEPTVPGGSAFDSSDPSTSDNEPTVIKRAISTSQQNGQPIEQSRGIPNAHEINNEFNLHLEKRTSNEDHPYKISMSSMDVANRFGKMYIGVSGAHHMLLPLPKEITYVRCVISDGEYEYMSRYEILGHQILMDYECVIDTKPGMIITVSLHVRPDYHVKPRTGWSKWFTSIRKQKEHLSGYVHPEDGAIGQTRFAVDHMVPGCHKKTYEAHFDCFNSWYARTNRERARREQFGDDEDFLKIVGKLNVEMLYLPVSSPSVPVPRSLRECDLTLKIRQWHDTCWQSGYLSTRRQGLKVWERHYYRLIGSQLIGYTSDGSDRQVWNHYNMSDVIRLSAAADKVIVTLVEEDDGKVFTHESIHAENHKGFFRLAFPDYHLDCVSDDLDESEEWVNTLKSMIGRVPLRLPFSD